MKHYLLGPNPLVIALMMIGWHTANCQTRLSVKGILFSAVRDEQVLESMALAHNWDITRKGLPLVERSEFRTETDRFDLQRQSYTLRITTNGLQEHRAQQNADLATSQLLATQTKLIVHEQLAERYEVLFRLRAIQEESTLKNQLKLIQEDKITVLQRKANAMNDWDIEDWIEAEQERDQISIELLEADNDAREIMRYITWALAITDSSIYAIDTSGWISLAAIAQVIQTLPDTPIAEHPRLQIDLDEAFIFDQRKKVEQANSRRILDYIQVQYQERVLFPWRYDVSVGMGIRLPYKGSTRRDMANLTLRGQQAEQKAILRNMEATRRITHLKTECDHLFKTLQVVDRLIQDNSAARSAERLARANTDPLLRLAINETQLKRLLKRQAIVQEIYANYVALLDQSGALSDYPLLNYFEQGQPTLTE
jgi:hypothetical protein